MNPDNCELACGLVSRSYVSQGQQALAKRERQVKALLSSRKLPEQGWDEASIEQLVTDLALMDSNNFLDNVGVGEREARVACPLVSRRHYRLAHGVGRSGDLVAEQPKAAGSSLLAKLTNCLAAHALSLAGLQDVGPVTVLPLSTGMALMMTLLALRPSRPGSKYVLWSRIDQKTCLKCITAAGYTPVVVELRQQGDELTTDVQALSAKLEELGAASVACVMTTTSCFAPRVPDDVVAVAKLCASAAVPHIINNAYGVQSASICSAITSAWRKGRVDAIVQSTDKNFMVPVGGSIVASSRQLPDLVQAVNKLYPGRAAVNAHLDLLMTLLHWGAQGWKQELQQREELYTHLHTCLTEAAATLGERVLSTPNNPISIAMTVNKLVAGPAVPAAEHATAGSAAPTSKSASNQGPTFLGSMLWARCISGTRVVAQGKKQNVAGLDFQNYGSHSNNYPHEYLTAAAAIGTQLGEAHEFATRLVKAYRELQSKQQQQGTGAAGGRLTEAS